MSYTIPLIMLGVYLLILVILTLRTPKSGKTSTFEDFYTGSKSMGAIVVGLVMMVTYYSGSTWTGWVGFAAINGSFCAYVIPYGVAAALGLYALSTRVWPLGKEYGLSTLADLYELRYRSTGLKILTGLIGAVMNVTWITMEIVTIGYIIKAASGGALSTSVGSLIGIVFMTAYTLWGGVRSVASVNVFQSILMVFGAIGVILYIVYANYDSVSSMFQIALDTKPEIFTMTSHASWFSFVVLCSVGVLCYPSLYLKLYLGKSPNEIKKSAIMNSFGSIWCVLILLGGFAVIGYETVTGMVIDNWEEAIPIILTNSGNAFMFGLMCIFVLAACMGTVDGTNLAISGIFSSDVILGFKRLSNKDALIGSEEYQPSAQNNVVLWTRIIVILVAACAYLITLFDLPLLVGIAMINYQGIGQLFIPLLGAILWKKATKAGTFAAIIGGFGVTVVLMISGVNTFGFLPGLWGLAVNVVLFIVVSLITYKEDNPDAIIYSDMKKAMEKWA